MIRRLRASTRDREIERREKRREGRRDRKRESKRERAREREQERERERETSRLGVAANTASTALINCAEYGGALA
jgi:hypothetical protein